MHIHFVVHKRLIDIVHGNVCTALEMFGDHLWLTIVVVHMIKKKGFVDRSIFTWLDVTLSKVSF